MSLSSDDFLPVWIEGGRIRPSFLGEVDLPWLRVLLEERERFNGRKAHELEERLRQPLPCVAPPAKLRLAIRVVTRLMESRVDSVLTSRVVRRTLFRAATRQGGPRADVIAIAAASLETTPDEVERALFADLPGERVVEPLDPSVTAQQLSLRANLALVRMLLARSSHVEIELVGASRAVVRHAKLRGLIANVRERGEDGVRLDVSGPFALFRHTLLYGRALGELVPFLAWCARYSLEAECVLKRGKGKLCLASGDPIFPAAEPKRYDSKLEERFAREFRKAATDWDLIREPEPVACGTSLLFPDFVLQHRTDPSRRWLLEIAGFWTPGYLEHKLARLREAKIANLILCIDETRNCSEESLPALARVIRYRRKIRIEHVLGFIEGIP